MYFHANYNDRFKMREDTHLCFQDIEKFVTINDAMGKKKRDELILVGPEDYFDDCPVCQAMKKAEEQNRNLSLKEMRKAFIESRKQGAIVGGSLISEESDKN